VYNCWGQQIGTQTVFKVSYAFVIFTLVNIKDKSTQARNKDGTKMDTHEIGVLQSGRSGFQGINNMLLLQHLPQGFLIAPQVDRYLFWAWAQHWAKQW
jgi:hypothetical protein